MSTPDGDLAADVLAGQTSYDGLGDEAQQLVREAWTDRVEFRLGELDYSARFAAAGEPWSELDEKGDLVLRTSC